MKSDDELGIEFEDRVARAIHRPLRQTTIPPFEQVRQRADRRRPSLVALPTAATVLLLALLVGGALEQRRALDQVTSQPTPTASAAAGVVATPTASPASPTTTPAMPGEIAAWRRVREMLSTSEPLAAPTWLPPSIDRSSVEIRELTKVSYVVLYQSDAGSVLAFAMGTHAAESGDARVSIKGVRRAVATLSFPQSVFDKPAAKALRRVQWQEGERWLRIESEELRSDDLVRIAWSLDLATAPAPAHPFTRTGTAPCATADPEATVRTWLALSGGGDGDAALDCYALARIEVMGPSIGVAWANLPKATLMSLERRADSGGRPQVLVTWTFATEPGGAWTTPATFFFLLAQEGAVYRIADMATAPIGPYP